MQFCQTETCRGFLSHWRSLRRGEAIPSLSDFLAVAHPKLQPHTVIKDVIQPGLCRVRLFATYLVDLVGVDLTGRNLIDFAANAAVGNELWQSDATVVRQPCGLISTKRAVTVSGRSFTFEDISLPLAPFPGGPPCVVCCVDPLENLDYKDTMFRIQGYVSARWIDAGFGTPAKPPPVGRQSRTGSVDHPSAVVS